MSDLTTKAKVKEYLGITGTDYDDLIDSLITRMSAFIETYCGRTFASTTYTDEKHDGAQENDGLLLPNQYPIISVTSLYDDTGRDFEASSLITATDYVVYLDSGSIQLDGAVFDLGWQNIKVTYVAGYATTPADLEQAAIELVSLKFGRRGSESLKSEKLGRWAAAYGNVPMTGDIQTVLTKYKNMRMAIV